MKIRFTKTVLKLLIISILIVSMGTGAFTQAGTFYVDTSGKPDNTGEKDSPLTFRAALDKASAFITSQGIPAEGINIIVQGGRYDYKAPFTLEAEFKGTTGQPILIKAAKGAEVVFDGSVKIAPGDFLSVTDANERSRLPASSVDNIVVATITDTDLINILNKELMLNLSFNGIDFLPSVFPNEGTANFQANPVTPEISPPAVPIGKEGYGVRAANPPYQEPGKPQGWRGSLAEPRGARVGINQKANEMAGSWQQWEDELSRNNKRNELVGYVSADWLLSAEPIYAASASDNTVHLAMALSYGWAWRNDKPFRVFGMLCELDNPGEWHFDPLTNRLFIYPPETITGETEIRVALAQGFIKLNTTEHVHVVGLSVENSASGIAYVINNGSYNLVASCKVSKCFDGIIVDGEYNRVLGCDFVDLNSHARLRGGSRSSSGWTYGNNSIENCHFYQKNNDHQKVNIALTGVGNTFRNNLIHNSIGQAMIVIGNDHLVELNELFNIGYKEGDGGAIYSGADMTGYGNVYRYNFLHHLIHLPGKVGRYGIYLDDHQAGSECIGNVFYKSANASLAYNNGAGHKAMNNIFLKGRIGAQIGGRGSNGGYYRQLEIDKDPNHQYKNTKENYIGRAEDVIGLKGWETSPWRNKYPLFYQVMSDDSLYGRYWPIRHEVLNNRHYQNRYNFSGYNGVSTNVYKKNIIKDGPDLSTGDFLDYGNMNFQFARGNDLPDIPFNNMGLYLDEYRNKMPDKSHYRNAIKNFFDGIDSWIGTTEYINTAKLVEEGPIVRLLEPVVLPEPAAYWPMDGKSGDNTIEDMIGSADGNWANTNTDGLNWETGVVGSSAAMNGATNNYFSVSSDPLAGTKALTLAAWIKPMHKVGYKGIIFSRAGDNSNGWGFASSDVTLDIRSATEEGLSVGVLDTNTWYHVAMTWDTAGIKYLYLNGDQILQDSTVKLYSSNGNWELGTDDTIAGREFTGSMDEVVIFDVALNSGNIRELYERGKSGVSIKDFLLGENNILDFEFPEQSGRASINYADTSITISVKAGTDITGLAPEVRISDSATISPETGTQDFTNPVTYTVTGKGGPQKFWKVKVNVDPLLSDKKMIKSMVLTEQYKLASIDTMYSTIELYVPLGTSTINLTPAISVSEGAVVDPPSDSAQNFTLPLSYTVTAEDGSTQKWTVLVVVSRVEVAGIKLAHNKKQIAPWGIFGLDYSLFPSQANNKAVRWSSSNPDVVYVNEGTIIGVSEGSAYITVMTDEGKFMDFCWVTVTDTGLTTVGEFGEIVPKSINNYPNPFKHTTTFAYSVPAPGYVNLSIYNILGEKQATLINEYKQTGNYRIELDASDYKPGAYIYRLVMNGKSVSKTMYKY